MSAPIQPSEPDEHEQHQIARTTAARRLAIGLLIVSAVFMLAVATFGVVLIRTSQKANTDTLTSAQRAATAAEKGTDLIQDCVTPDGECAKRGQRQTAKALVDIARGNMVTLSCAFTIDPDVTAEEFLASLGSCVERLSGGQAR